VSTTPHRHQAPPANKGLLAVAGVLVAIPIIALLLVGTYAKDEPRLGAFPFFIWYQFLWVAITSVLTYTAYRIVLRARPHVPMTPEGDAFLDDGAADGDAAPGGEVR
jgi:membrane protein implicated in regulation of membrane protease activity